MVDLLSLRWLEARDFHEGENRCLSGENFLLAVDGGERHVRPVLEVVVDDPDFVAFWVVLEPQLILVELGVLEVAFYGHPQDLRDGRVLVHKNLNHLGGVEEIDLDGLPVRDGDGVALPGL